MTRVDFYQLPDKDLDASLRFACRLCLKALGSYMPVHIRVDDQPQAQAVETALRTVDASKRMALRQARGGRISPPHSASSLLPQPPQSATSSHKLPLAR